MKAMFLMVALAAVGMVHAGSPDRDWPSVVVTPVFGNDQASMWWERPGLVPMRVERQGDDLLIEVQNDNFTADQLAVMGAGERAEVKTVPEVLP